jgi:hypothetical protein
MPSEWVNLVRTANTQKPFEVQYVNFPLTDNLIPDNTPIVTVFNYKELMENCLRPHLTHLTEVRRVKFIKNSIKVSIDLTLEPDIDLTLLKNDFYVDLKLLFSNIKPAYDNFIPHNKAKYDDIKKLLNYVNLPKEATFYDEKYLKFEICNVVKHGFNPNSFNISCIDYCKCNGFCVRKCFCKKNKSKCNTLCLCNKNMCKNFN